MAEAGDPQVVRIPRYATLEETVRSQAESLIRRYGAHHIGISKKVRGGEKLAESCITFYVTRKGDVPRDQMIPRHLPLKYRNGSGTRMVATDVCEMKGLPVALQGLRGGHVITADDNENGTVGLVFTANGRDYLITNAHVVTDPGRPPGPVGAGGFVGTVTKIDDLRPFDIHSDAALVQMPSGTVRHGEFRGQSLRMIGVGDFAPNDPRTFYFVSNNYTHTAKWQAKVDTGAEITVDNSGKRYWGFAKFQVTDGPLVHGDSGAVVFCSTGTGLIAVGLLFGGELASRVAWVFPIRKCLNRLGVSLPVVG